MLKNKFNDIYTKLARIHKLRSRSWFKLEEIQKTEKVIKPNKLILDLGASPGGWSNYLVKNIKNSKGNIIACDILPMKKINGVHFLQYNIYHYKEVIKKILDIVKGKKFSTILSDLSHNICGIPEVDICKSMEISEIVLKICNFLLVNNGNLLIKVFQSQELKKYLYEVRSLFKKVKIKRLKASRNYSRELYIVAMGYRI